MARWRFAGDLEKGRGNRACVVWGAGAMVGRFSYFLIVTGVLTTAPRGSVTVMNHALNERSGAGPLTFPFETVRGLVDHLRLLMGPSSTVAWSEADLISTWLLAWRVMVLPSI